MPMPAAEIERMIKQSLPDAEVEITDLAGDNDHYAAVVVSSAFVGKSKLQQHQLVYQGAGRQYGRRSACAAAADLSAEIGSSRKLRQSRKDKIWPFTIV